jgi:transglutaminase-like putative cysteine protease
MEGKENIEKWLQEGNQTRITPEIKELANSIGGEKLEYIMNLLLWGKENISTFPKSEWKENFRNRSADEIIKSQKASGCGDRAVVFCALSRAKGIPTVYIELPYKDWLESDNDQTFVNHCMVKVRHGDRWYIADPTRGTIGVGGYRSVGESVDYVKLGEGLDSWDLGIKDWDSYREKYLEFRKKYQSSDEDKRS